MHRRKFLGTVAVGLGATALPVWLSRSFGLADETCPADPAAPPPDPPRQPAPPPTCSAQPGVAVKPLLVLIVPADHQPTQWDRGHAFGELLNHGSDEQLGLLARYDVVCRRVDQLDEDVRAVVKGEPLMVVLDPFADVPIRPLHAELPQHPEWHLWREQHPADDLTAAEERIIDQRIDLLADLLHGAATRDSLGAQALREHAALACPEAQLLRGLPDDLHRLSPALIDRAAAMTMTTARGADADTRARLWALLAAAARIRLTDRPIDGAPWARGGGCGVVVENDPNPHGMACGMGHVPRRSTRFLKFYASRY